jgi:CheY-like chemotaxis protein
MQGHERARRRPILVLDGDPSTRQVITQALEEAGYTVDSVGSAREALALLAQQRPRAMLVDLTQPGAAGWAFLAHRRQQLGGRTLPIVVVSTSAMQGTAGGAWGQDYRWLPKGFEPDQLLTLMEELTRPRAARPVAAYREPLPTRPSAVEARGRWAIASVRVR